MCGIAGIAYNNLDPAQVRDQIKKMNTVQNHRGPDADGVFHSNNISLGHTRLAIIDLSDLGKQPMLDTTKRYCITYNGEIYNYKELTNELKSYGFIFQGHSDTEVLLYSYIKWRENCLDHLRGMFAFSIWDDNKKILFGARDRMGIKPFHYIFDDNKNLFFSSEIKALLPFLIKREINPILARQFLQWNILDHNVNDTMIKDISKLPPGHSFTWEWGGDFKIKKYWGLDNYKENLVSKPNPQDLKQNFRNRFDEVIHLHMRSDVEIGTSLSGGLDSSVILVAIKDQLSKKNIINSKSQYSFSACFDQKNIDERPFIESIINHTGVNSSYTFPKGESLLEDVENWLWHQEEPVGNTGPYAQYCVMRLAKNNKIKVLLDGQGGDELLGGYRKFIFSYIRQLYNEKKYRKAIINTIPFISISVLKTSFLTDGWKYFSKKQGFENLLWPQMGEDYYPENFRPGSSLKDRLVSDLLHYSLPVLLRYEDRNSMAFGIESRVPFVDHKFIEWAIKVPDEFIIQNGYTKYIMRMAYSDLLPKKILNRKSKLGFETPRNKWMGGALKPWIKSMLSDPKYLYEIVDKQGAQTLYSQFYNNKKERFLYDIIFRMAIYEQWGRLFLS